MGHLFLDRDLLAIGVLCRISTFDSERVSEDISNDSDAIFHLATYSVARTSSSKIIEGRKEFRLEIPGQNDQGNISKLPTILSLTVISFRFSTSILKSG